MPWPCHGPNGSKVDGLAEDSASEWPGGHCLSLGTRCAPRQPNQLIYLAVSACGTTASVPVPPGHAAAACGWLLAAAGQRPAAAASQPCMMHETEKLFGPFRSFQLQAESGSCVALSGHLAAMMGPRAFLLHRDTAAMARLYRVHTRSTLRSATSPPTNLWAVRREWLRSARSDTNPTHLPPSVVAHRATTLTTFVAVSVHVRWYHK
eukprot:COSAG04_NODE_492_length_13438_cov_2.453782_4_plen_207_part_00